MWGGMMWPSLETTPKTITVAGNFVFITLGTLNRLDLHFEGAGNGPVVITWIGREHELYSGASPILLVEHCVTFRHDRRLLSLLGFVHNWPTSRWSATKKRKPVFINRKWNHVVFSIVTMLSFHSVISPRKQILILKFIFRLFLFFLLFIYFFYFFAFFSTAHCLFLYSSRVYSFIHLFFTSTYLLSLSLSHSTHTHTSLLQYRAWWCNAHGQQKRWTSFEFIRHFSINNLGKLCL